MITGTLELQMVANMAQLTTDMAKANRIVGDAVSTMEKALGAIGLAFSATALIEKINSVVTHMEHLSQASAKTGASIEQLSKLEFFAGVSGSSAEGVTMALVRLSRSMSMAGNDSVIAGQALRYLGLSATDSAGHLKDPAALLGEIAQKLANYQDGAGKAAIAQALFGRGGAEILPMLKQMVQLGGAEATVTTEQAKQAEAYSLTIARLKEQKEILANTIVTAVLPAMNSFAQVLTEAFTNEGSLAGKIEDMATKGTLSDWADASAMGVARVIDVTKTLIKVLLETEAPFENLFRKAQTGIAALTILLDKKPGHLLENDPAHAAALEQLRKDADEETAILKKRYADGSFWTAKIDTQTSDALAKKIDAEKKYRSFMAGIGADKSLDETMMGGGQQGKSTLDFQPINTAAAKAAERAYQEFILGMANNELAVFKDTKANEQALLDSAYADFRRSDLMYYTEKTTLAHDAAAAERSTLETLRQSQVDDLNKLKPMTAEYWMALKKIDDTEAKIAKVGRDNAQFNQISYEQMRREVEKYQRSIEAVNIQILQMRGNTAAAAAAQFDLSNRDLKSKIAITDDPAGAAALKTLEDLTVRQAMFNQQRERLGRINSSLQMLEAVTQTQVKTGQISEEDGLKRISAARAAALPEMEKTVDFLKQTAAESHNATQTLEAQQAQTDLFLKAWEGQGAAVVDSLKFAEESEKYSYATRSLNLELYLKSTNASYEMAANLRARLESQHAAQLKTIELNKNRAIYDMQVTTWQAAGDLLQQFAGKSRAAAIAAIAIQKGLAIASVVVNTEGAIARGYLELGPWGGAAFEAKMRTMEAISIGLIAATGLAQASQVGSGGASAGSPANPVNVTPGVGATPAAAQAGQTTVIHLYGDSIGRKQLQDLIGQINDGQRDGSRIVLA